MRLLHTSDWHVGRTIRGHSRAAEHRAVLAEIAGIAEDRDVEVVVVAGDLFETAAPSPESEEIVYRALLQLTRAGTDVVVVAGNHDNARRLAAVAPLLELGRVHVVGAPRRPDDGGVRVVQTRSGERVRVALLPFVSQRGIVRAAELMEGAAFEHAQHYADRVTQLLGVLCAGFDASMPNVVVAHAFVAGGTPGGGERLAHLVEEYRVPAPAFPASAQYVALGHLHRPQRVAGATAIHYCGSPLQLDFGEEDQAKQVNVVELAAGVPARVTTVPLRAGRPLHTLTTTTAELAAAAAGVADDAWLRVVLAEERRAGLADEVRSQLGERAVEVRVERTAPAGGSATRGSRRGRSPGELFAEFCAEQGVADGRLHTLFAELYEAEVQADLPAGSAG